MSNQIKLVGTLFIIALALQASAQGVFWSTRHIGGSGAVPHVPQPPSLRIVFDYGWQGAADMFLEGGDPATRIFSLNITTNDSGRTFFADATTDPGFAGFVARLTDGTQQYITQEIEYYTISEWAPQPEADFLRRPFGSPDLNGYHITQIGLRLNSFYNYTEGNYEFGYLDYSMDFYGTAVPEPRAYALLGLGVAAFLMRKRAGRR